MSRLTDMLAANTTARPWSLSNLNGGTPRTRMADAALILALVNHAENIQALWDAADDARRAIIAEHKGDTTPPPDWFAKLAASLAKTRDLFGGAKTEVPR